MRYTHVQRLLAEAAGTLLFVYFGSAALAAAAGMTGLTVGVALAHAVALALVVWAFGAVSGAHINPTITLALAIRGRFAWREVPGYIVAQLVGGVLGGLLIWATHASAGVNNAVTTTGTGTGVAAAVVAELMAAVLLVTAYYALVTHERTSHGIAGLGVGLAYGAGILGLAALTGASANFARTLGVQLTSLFAGNTPDWTNIWIYAVAPIVGGVIAVFGYDALTGALAMPRRATRAADQPASPSPA